jgi:hypothetical protein
MNRTELKKMLKPLIKECIKEVIFEEGVLSGIISEVVSGTRVQPVLEATPPNRPATTRKESEVRRSKKLQETRERMAAAIGKDAYAGVFENTTPLKSAGSPSPAGAPSSPLAAYAPEDAGINIEGLLAVAGEKWGKLRG